MTANLSAQSHSAQVHGYGDLTFVESDEEKAVFQLVLKEAFDSCAIYEALDCLAIKHETDLNTMLTFVRLYVKVGAPVRNPEGFTKMWARKLQQTAEECRKDYLKSVQIIEEQPEVVMSSCPHCGFLETHHFPGGDIKVLDAIGEKLHYLHKENSPDCPYFASWC